MTDRLAALLDHFAITARVFHSGALCGINDLPGDGDTGQLHLIRQGAVDVLHGGVLAARISEPSLLLYPLPMAHRFVTDAAHGADFACARLRFEGGPANPLAAALPPFLHLPLSALQGAGPVLELLFAEASARHCGREAMLDRLFEVVLIQVLRQLMEAGQIQVGMLAGLAHPRLRLALVAMHDDPARDWSLDALAETAGMSRSVFANTFRERVGSTPLAYLQAWRISLAQRALRQGRSLKWVSASVGYGSEAAFSRAFKACNGVSPRQWLASRE
ncbi:AraC family transcriptional regulator [Zoogloea dura]|uniref:AraC family transcriptional regulator n=1 Tax=Zoogloea dura TaxID=2728840 RepID=A0A848GBV6_9RHOO|nr:AraC family transcriptional regulator [Zoogloea dura]NML29059.1 AraC family transcriptional regulator [Zoogloea dura]